MRYDAIVSQALERFRDAYGDPPSPSDEHDLFALASIIAHLIGRQMESEIRAHFDQATALIQGRPQ
jgi:hypothetical protein